MTSIQPADLRARRQAILLVLVGAIVGVLGVATLDPSRAALGAWLLSDPELTASRVRLAAWSLAAALSLPLTGFAAYLWSIGVKAVRAQQLPPPGVRVIRDTPIRIGAAAVRRGRLLQALALCLIGAAASLLLAILQLAEIVIEQVV